MEIEEEFDKRLTLQSHLLKLIENDDDEQYFYMLT